MTSQSVITALKSLFARYGIPQEVVSDNGPQYSSQEFAQFATQYDFRHSTSSPHFPQSNGQAERGVQTVKKMLKGSKDPFMALLTYRATPLPWCSLSPSQLLMGRQIRSNIPQMTETLTPQWPYLEEFRRANIEFKQKQKIDYDTRHGTRPLPEIPTDTDVWVTTNNSRSPGRVTGPANTPRSYLVETPSRQIRRNRSHLTVEPNPPSPGSSNSTEPTSDTPRSPIMTRTRTSTNIAAPNRLGV